MSLTAAAVLAFLLRCPTGYPAQSVLTPEVASSSAPSPGLPLQSGPNVYGAIRDQLRSSGVPVLLPVPLPRAIEPARSITVVTADRTGYVVGFSPETRCFEALSCSFFHVSGFARTALADRSYRNDRPVRLSDGTRGFFRPEDCSGASCTEASLTFERSGAIYEIDVKVGRADLLVLKSAYRNLRLFR